ncbi:MAG: pyridoxal phosphate-dependent aminotransferase [Planctomycetota bacterium]
MSAPFSSAGAAAARCEHGGAFWNAIGDDLRTLEKRAGVINADVLDAWFPPSPRIIAAIEPHLEWLIRTSPPTGCEGMIRCIAECRDLDARCVLPGDGSSALIFLAFREWLISASRALVLDPSYGEYAHVLEQVVGCSVERFALARADGFQVDVAQLARRLADGYDVVVIVNPNSPTGRYVSRAELERVLAAAPARTRFWIDETYIDYAGAGESLERFAASRPNVVVAKSMSKVYALSGLRAAYLVAAPSIIESLARRTPPWAVSLPAQVAAIEALRDTSYYESRWNETHTLRAEFADTLGSRLSFAVTPSVANFILCQLPSAGPAAEIVCERARARGLYLRDTSSMSQQLGRHSIRIAVKDWDTNQRILEILAACVSP